jgi:hypothetical protein
MVPEAFTPFFLAAAGAGGAFIGLVFVALTIRREGAGAGEPHQYLAEATLLTFLNAFFVATLALIPGLNLGWVALGLGWLGVAIALQLGQRLLRWQRQGQQRPLPWHARLRVVSLSLVAGALYAVEGLLGSWLLLRPGSVGAFRALALIVVGIYWLGIVRAWTLLGDPQHGWSGWLNPLQRPAAGSLAAPSRAGHAPSGAQPARVSSRPRRLVAAPRGPVPPPDGGGEGR